MDNDLMLEDAHDFEPAKKRSHARLAAFLATLAPSLNARDDHIAGQLGRDNTSAKSKLGKIYALMADVESGRRLYLIADAQKGIPLRPIVEVLDALPAPIVEEAWDGESEPIVPIFVSPGAMNRTEPAKSVAEKSSKPSVQRNSVGYVQTFVGPQRRPKGRMPINAHAEVGGLLKSVLVATHHRKGVYNRLNYGP